MPFLLLLVLTLVCLQTDWPKPPFDMGILGSALLTWGGVAVLWVVAELLSRRLCRRLRAYAQGLPDAFRTLGSTRRYFLYALLAFYALALYGFGWGHTGKTLLGSTKDLVP